MNRPAHVDRIFREVARRYEVPVGAITAKDNSAPMPEVRAVIAFRLRHEMRRTPSFPEIGRYLHRHHTSILAMLRRVPEVEPETPFDPNAPDLSGEWAI